MVLLTVNSIYLTLVHQLWLDGIPWEYAAFTGLGAVFGARLAPWLARHIDADALKAVFAAVAIGDGIVFILQYLAMGKFIIGYRARGRILRNFPCFCPDSTTPKSQLNMPRDLILTMKRCILCEEAPAASIFICAIAVTYGTVKAC